LGREQHGDDFSERDSLAGAAPAFRFRVSGSGFRL